MQHGLQSYLTHQTVRTHGVMAATRTALDVNRRDLHGRAVKLGSLAVAVAGLTSSVGCICCARPFKCSVATTVEVCTGLDCSNAVFVRVHERPPSHPRIPPHPRPVQSESAVTTAPTNGAAGIIPAVLQYGMNFMPRSGARDVDSFLLVVAAVGVLCKKNAFISDAEVGCQGEVGSACAGRECGRDRP